MSIIIMGSKAHRRTNQLDRDYLSLEHRYFTLQVNGSRRAKRYRDVKELVSDVEKLRKQDNKVRIFKSSDSFWDRNTPKGYLCESGIDVTSRYKKRKGKVNIYQL